MKKVVVIALIALMAVSFAFSQTTVGIRGGIRSGLSFRFPAGEGNATEVLLTYRNGLILTGMYQWHRPIGDLENFSWFIGGGLHAGISWVTDNTPAFGIDGIIGIEYDFESLLSIPLKLSLDYKPAYDFIGVWAEHWSNGAFTLRYTF